MQMSFYVQKQHNGREIKNIVNIIYISISPINERTTGYYESMWIRNYNTHTPKCCGWKIVSLKEWEFLLKEIAALTYSPFIQMKNMAISNTRGDP